MIDRYSKEFFQKTGRQGGKSKSAAKVAAARLNGKKSKGPRKVKANGN